MPVSCDEAPVTPPTPYQYRVSGTNHCDPVGPRDPCGPGAPCGPVWFHWSASSAGLHDSPAPTTRSWPLFFW
jgi:hypothetical protein